MPRSWDTGADAAFRCQKVAYSKIQTKQVHGGGLQVNVLVLQGPCAHLVTFLPQPSVPDGKDAAS